METDAIIKALAGVIVVLAGIIAWLEKRDRKERREREKEAQRREDNFLTIIQQNNLLYEKNLEILVRIESLLTNWRGH